MKNESFRGLYSQITFYFHHYSQQPLFHVSMSLADFVEVDSLWLDAFLHINPCLFSWKIGTNKYYLFDGEPQLQLLQEESKLHSPFHTHTYIWMYTIGFFQFPCTKSTHKVLTNRRYLVFYYNRKHSPKVSYGRTRPEIISL